MDHIRTFRCRRGKKNLEKNCSDFDTYLENGQIEIIPYTHIKNDVLDPKKIWNEWFERIDQILARGYDGLRLSINTFWMGNKYCNDFIEYGKKIDRATDKQRIICCNYSLDRCKASEIIEIPSIHQFSLIKKEGK